MPPGPPPAIKCSARTQDARSDVQRAFIYRQGRFAFIASDSDGCAADHADVLAEPPNSIAATASAISSPAMGPMM